MALRVIGAGLGRTGTLSLKVALEQLGFGPCYHMMEVLMSAHAPTRIGHWDAITTGNPPPWGDVFEGFASTVDWPACNYYRELMAEWPDAKVILSCREDARRWFASTQATIFATENPPPFIARLTSAILGADVHDEAACTAAYEAHNAAVIAYVPPERLLVFRPGDGWEPLCAFLDVAVPDTAYPHTNTTEDFQAMMAARQQAATR